MPEKAGHTGKWEGLETAELENILFDITFKAAYVTYSSVIESEQTRENGLPILLLEGSFTDQANICVNQSNVTPALAKGEVMLECWQITVDNSANTARFLHPDGVNAQNMKLLLSVADGEWREVSFSQDESYLVIPVEPGNQHLALVGVQTNYMPWVIAGVGAAVLIVLVIALPLRKKKLKKVQESVSN